MLWGESAGKDAKDLDVMRSLKYGSAELSHHVQPALGWCQHQEKQWVFNITPVPVSTTAPPHRRFGFPAFNFPKKCPGIEADGV